MHVSVVVLAALCVLSPFLFEDVFAIKSSNQASLNDGAYYNSYVAWFNSTGTLFCSGAMIGPYHVVTAAHCFMDIQQSPTIINREARAAVGIRNMYEDSDKYRINNIYIHPSFNSLNFQSHPGDVVDLAVVELADAIHQGGQYENTEVVIANDDAPFPNDFTVFGFGTENRGTRINLVLKKITNFKRSSDETCLFNPRFLGPGHFNDFNPENYMCMAKASQSGSMCEYDGGSPLYYMQTSNQAQPPTQGQTNPQTNIVTTNDQVYLAGIFSTLTPGGDCGATTVPISETTPYTRPNQQRFVNLIQFGPWIQSVVGHILPYQYYAIDLIKPRTPPPTSNPTAGPLMCEVRDCGGPSSIASCWCDTACAVNNDCCSNVESRCNNAKDKDQVDLFVPPGTGTGTCSEKGICGVKSSGHCWCDSECTANQDCCGDYVLYCASAVGGGDYSCVGKCGYSSGQCWCDDDCISNNDCCPDYQVCIFDDGVLGLGNDDGHGSCNGKCGQQSGQCWCDHACAYHGDCCPNYSNQCGDELSCQGFCGHWNTHNCWCDVTCHLNGDCCEDFHDACTHLLEFSDHFAELP